MHQHYYTFPHRPTHTAQGEDAAGTQYKSNLSSFRRQGGFWRQVPASSALTSKCPLRVRQGRDEREGERREGENEEREAQDTAVSGGAGEALSGDDDGCVPAGHVSWEHAGDADDAVCENVEACSSGLIGDEQRWDWTVLRGSQLAGAAYGARGRCTTHALATPNPHSVHGWPIPHHFVWVPRAPTPPPSPLLAEECGGDEDHYHLDNRLWRSRGGQVRVRRLMQNVSAAALRALRTDLETEGQLARQSARPS